MTREGEGEVREWAEANQGRNATPRDTGCCKLDVAWGQEEESLGLERRTAKREGGDTIRTKEKSAGASSPLRYEKIDAFPTCQGQKQWATHPSPSLKAAMSSSCAPSTGVSSVATRPPSTTGMLCASCCQGSAHGIIIIIMNTRGIEQQQQQRKHSL